MTTIDYARYDDIAAFLEREKQEISRRMAPLNDVVPEPHVGPAYEKAVFTFSRAATALFKAYRPRLFTLADRISALGGPKGSLTPQNIKLWFAVARDILPLFSEHPTKKVGALLINANNHMIAWGFNRVPVGIPRRGSHYRKTERKNYIVCGEREKFARLHGLRISLFEGRNPTDAEVRETVQNYTDTLVALGRAHPLPPGTTMYSSTLPCSVCTPVIIAHAPATLVTDMNANIHFKRAANRRENLEAMIQAGIRVIDINTLAPPSFG